VGQGIGVTGFSRGRSLFSLRVVRVPAVYSAAPHGTAMAQQIHMPLAPLRRLGSLPDMGMLCGPPPKEGGGRQSLTEAGHAADNAL